MHLPQEKKVGVRAASQTAKRVRTSPAEQLQAWWSSAKPRAVVLLVPAAFLLLVMVSPATSQLYLKELTACALIITLLLFVRASQ